MGSKYGKSYKGAMQVTGYRNTTWCVVLPECGLPLRPSLPSSKDPPTVPGKKNHWLSRFQPQFPQPYLAQVLGYSFPLCLNPVLCPHVQQAFIPLLWSSLGPVGHHLHRDILSGGHCTLCRGSKVDGLGLQTLFGFKKNSAL